jgi:hypothetical protein
MVRCIFFSLLNPLNNKRNIARTIKEEEARMEMRDRLPQAVLGLAMLAALPAPAQEPAQASELEALRQQQAARMADGFAHLHGFGEGVAAALAASAPVKRVKLVEGFNGKLTLKTYRQPGIELTTMSGGGNTFPASLTISRADYQLPLGLRIGDPRGAVEELLGAPSLGGDTLVLKRTQGEGCDDPIVLSFRNKLLTRVAWTWESCQD